MFTTMKKKQELTDVFNGLSSLLYQSAVADLSQATLSITPEYDLPVTVDTLQISQEDPTVNHYKVIGLDGDWTSSATLGNMNIQFTVPTKAKEVLQLAYGEDAVKEITKLTINTGDADIDNAQGYSGVSLNLKKKKICYSSMQRKTRRKHQKRTLLQFLLHPIRLLSPFPPLLLSPLLNLKRKIVQ